MNRSGSLLLVLVLSLLLVPCVATAAPPERAGVTASTTVADRVNINRADVKELMTLSGIGRKVAERIVEYRDAHGPFKKPEDLRKVDGIGAGLFERNRERIVIK